MNLPHFIPPQVSNRSPLTCPAPLRDSAATGETEGLLTPGSAAEFCLEETARFCLRGTRAWRSFPRWVCVTHYCDNRHALVLVPGEELCLSDKLTIHKDTRLYLRYAAALPRINGAGLVCEILYSEATAGAVPASVAALYLKGGVQVGEWRTIDLDLGWLAGRSVLISLCCHQGSGENLSGRERVTRFFKGFRNHCQLALAELCIARQDRLSLVKARSFSELRSKNELAHFSSAYQDSLYAKEQSRLAQTSRGQLRPVRKASILTTVDVPPNASPSLPELVPLPGEHPYSYAHRLLAASLPQPLPDFVERLRLKAQSGPVKVLSLCSGAARIEAGYAEQVPDTVEWSLLDINSDLLRLASRQFGPKVKLDLIEANVNALVDFGEKWDVILCVSGLHHVVELERLMKFCHDCLNQYGEFWSIGESVGRNGNRLWPEAREQANAFFRQLPEKFRKNRHTSQIDLEIPDNDYSTGCFEGIRSEEIESILDIWFKPIDVYRRNCFLWRLVNLAYSDNYDLQNPENRSWLRKAVCAELRYFRSGGRGVELFGVYSPRAY
jgi:SAM-dependent methyltransferase